MAAATISPCPGERAGLGGRRRRHHRLRRQLSNAASLYNTGSAPDSVNGSYGDTIVFHDLIGALTASDFV